MWAKNLYDCNDPADYAYCTCAIYSCGYSQPNRKHISIAYLESGTAECDCSSGVSWWLFMGGFINENPWFHTRIERQYLIDNGFTTFPFGALPLKRNDILWREGHTGIYIGEGLQAEALRDENYQAGYEGTIPGDQDGGETVVRDVTQDWTYVLRKAQVPIKELISMTFLFTCDGKHKGHVYFYDGGHIFKVNSKEQQECIKNAYKFSHNDAQIPFFNLPNGDVLFDVVLYYNERA